MREVKFRVRSQISKSVIGFETLMPDISNDRWRWAKSFAGVDWEDGVYDDDYFIRDQYIGVTDKHGRDIYEADIVRAWSEGYQHVGEVRWRDAADGGACPCYIIFPAWAHQQFWHLNGGPHDHAIEVIGNIYENPELIRPA
jgi:hypothetical protein